MHHYINLSIGTIIFVLIFATQLSGCGIPEEQYNAKVQETLKLKQDLADANAAYEEMQKKINNMRTENQTLANKLSEMGEDVNKLLGEKSTLASDLEQTRAREERLQKERDAQLARMKKYRKVISKFQDLISSGKLKIRIVDGQMVVEMASNILFETGKAKLSEKGEAALSELATILIDIKERKFQVAGHTDNVPINSRKFPSNWELSSARAVTVVKFLQKNNVDPKNISASGYAEYQPVKSNDTHSGQSANRRIEIVLLPNLDELPDLSDLEQDLEN